MIPLFLPPRDTKHNNLHLKSESLSHFAGGLGGGGRRPTPTPIGTGPTQTPTPKSKAPERNCRTVCCKTTRSRCSGFWSRRETFWKQK